MHDHEHDVHDESHPGHEVFDEPRPESAVPPPRFRPMRQRPLTTEQRKRREYALSRRTFLRGVGVTMALPWLESLNVFGTAARGTAAAAESVAAAAVTTAPVAGMTAAGLPQRFAVMFMGNGINGNHWWAKGSGENMK